MKRPRRADNTASPRSTSSDVAPNDYSLTGLASEETASLEFASNWELGIQIGRDAGDEAVAHFFAHWNEKFYASQDEYSIRGFDYIRPVYDEDARRAGPVPEIIHAVGLAALGNTKCAPHLLVQARQKQVQVLGRLHQQLQDPMTALSDSSILTCILLSLFEVSRRFPDCKPGTDSLTERYLRAPVDTSHDISS